MSKFVVTIVLTVAGDVASGGVVVVNRLRQTNYPMSLSSHHCRRVTVDATKTKSSSRTKRI